MNETLKAILTELKYSFRPDGVWERAEGNYRMEVDTEKRLVIKWRQRPQSQVALSNYFDLESFICALGRVTDKF